jgi:uncharacterized membrane protein
MKLCPLALAVSCFLFVPSVYADVHIIDLGSPGSPARLSPSDATAISPDGKTIVGTWQASDTALPQQGWIAPNASNVYVATDLGLPPATVRVAPTGINNDQIMVGWLRNAPNNAVAFYARPPYFGSGMFAPVPITGLTGNSQAQAINPSGVIVGHDSSGSSGASQSFVFTLNSSGDGTLQRIKGLQSSTASEAHAVNGAGAIAGWAVNCAGERQAFVAQSADGAVSQPAIKLSGGEAVHWSEARAINARGDIAGCSAASAGTAGDCSGTIVNVNSGIEAFIVHNGTPVSLGVPSGFAESFALGISDHGLVVGTAHGSGGSSAFLWYFDAGQLRTIDLTTLLPDNNSFISLTSATAITDIVIGITPTTETLRATIVGQGLTPDSLAHAFRLNVDVVVAVPEPATWVLLLAGLTLVGWAGSRRVHATASPAAV